MAHVMLYVTYKHCVSFQKYCTMNFFNKQCVSISEPDWTPAEVAVIDKHATSAKLKWKVGDFTSHSLHISIILIHVCKGALLESIFFHPIPWCVKTVFPMAIQFFFFRI